MDGWKHRMDGCHPPIIPIHSDISDPHPSFRSIPILPIPTHHSDTPDPHPSPTHHSDTHDPSATVDRWDKELSAELDILRTTTFERFSSDLLDGPGTCEA